eukprot:TRINITY_DN61338_c0_g1_i1.p1 TRINITY_DN61338_c0_g1~~TRINITY_DN61338_c0_g1_i1.p1  ORF type:complete len:455 (+),score=128.81 TRINITY_DN61338_c0_g1_i1:103-1467(+)
MSSLRLRVGEHDAIAKAVAASAALEAETAARQFRRRLKLRSFAAPHPGEISARRPKKQDLQAKIAAQKASARLPVVRSQQKPLAILAPGVEARLLVPAVEQRSEVQRQQTRLSEDALPLILQAHGDARQHSLPASLGRSDEHGKKHLGLSEDTSPAIHQELATLSEETLSDEDPPEVQAQKLAAVLRISDFPELFTRLGMSPGADEDDKDDATPGAAPWRTNVKRLTRSEKRAEEELDKLLAMAGSATEEDFEGSQEASDVDEALADQEVAELRGRSQEGDRPWRRLRFLASRLGSIENPHENQELFDQWTDYCSSRFGRESRVSPRDDASRASGGRISHMGNDGSSRISRAPAGRSLEHMAGYREEEQQSVAATAQQHKAVPESSRLPKVRKSKRAVMHVPFGGRLTKQDGLSLPKIAMSPVPVALQEVGYRRRLRLRQVPDKEWQLPALSAR